MSNKSAVVIGMLAKAASVGLSSGDLNNLLQKEAWELGGVVKSVSDLAFKIPVAVALFSGIPAGVAAHLVGKKIKKNTMEEESNEQKLQYYNRLAKDIKTELGYKQ